MTKFKLHRNTEILYVTKTYCKPLPMYLKKEALGQRGREDLNFVMVKKKLQVIKSNYMKEESLVA